MIIRTMNAQDIDRILEIEQRSFPAPWSREIFATELINPLAYYVVATEKNCVIGYIGMWCIFDEGHITNVAVDPAKRGEGIGTRLLLHMEQFAAIQGITKLTLEVRPSNLAARRLYKQLNYVEVGLRKRYYSDNNEDAIIMTKVLTGVIPQEENY